MPSTNENPEELAGATGSGIRSLRSSVNSPEIIKPNQHANQAEIAGAKRDLLREYVYEAAQGPYNFPAVIRTFDHIKVIQKPNYHPDPAAPVQIASPQTLARRSDCLSLSEFKELQAAADKIPEQGTECDFPDP